MQAIHIAAKNGCPEILKYIGTLPGVDPHAVASSTVKCKILQLYCIVIVGVIGEVCILMI